MAWVVKRWRMDGLERVLTAEARASAQAAREAADRDARRARRAADRAGADAAAQLEALERLGLELVATVHRVRGTSSAEAAPAAAAPAPDPAAPAAPPVAAAPLVAVPAARRRPARASMRNSALNELFRATTAG
jgi:hypothetical protein